MGRSSSKKAPQKSKSNTVVTKTRARAAIEICEGCNNPFSRRGIVGHKKKCLKPKPAPEPGLSIGDADDDGASRRALAESLYAIIKGKVYSEPSSLNERSVSPFSDSMIEVQNSMIDVEAPEDRHSQGHPGFNSESVQLQDKNNTVTMGSVSVGGASSDSDADSRAGSALPGPNADLSMRSDFSDHDRNTNAAVQNNSWNDEDDIESILSFDPNDYIHEPVQSHATNAEMQPAVPTAADLERQYPHLQEDDIVIQYHPKSRRPPIHVKMSDNASAHPSAINSRRVVPPSARAASSVQGEHVPGSQIGTNSFVPKQEQKPWFPFSSELDFDIAEFALDAHLNTKQKNRLLSILTRTAKAPADLTLDSAKDIQSLWDLACRRTNGLVKKEGTARFSEDQEDTQFDVWTRPIWDWVLELLGNEDIASKCHWDAERQFKHNGETLERFWDEPWTGDAWWEAQTNLPDGATPVCILIYADQTRLSSFGTAKAYPVIARLLNLPIELRHSMGIEGGRVVGWLPIVEAKQAKDSKQKADFVNLKRVIWHKAFYELLYALAGTAKTGHVFKCGDGIFRWLFPIILILSADYDEQTFMALIRGLKGLYPCPRCLVPNTDLANLATKFPLRTTSSMKKIYEQAQNLSTNKEKEKILQQYGLRDIENVFWMFEGSDTDIYSALTFDRLHNNHSGTFPDHILKLIKQIISKLDGSFGQKLDEYANEMPSWAGLNHFKSIMKAPAFTDGTKHEDMSKILIYAAASILTPAISSEGYLLLKILRSYIELDMYASLGVHTERTIQHGEAEVLLYSSLLAEHTEKYGTKDWNFPKIHGQQHLFDDIRRKGVTRNANTKLGEKQHRAFKKFYMHHTNFKDTDKQILRLEQESLTCLMIRRDIDEYHEHQVYLQEIKDDTHEETISGSRTVERRTNLVSHRRSERRRVGTDYVTFGSPLPALTLRDIEQNVGAVDPSFKDFRRRLSQAMSKWENIPVRLDISTIITRYQYFKVAFQSIVSWQDLTDILRANPNFNNSPRYDCVLVKQPGNNDGVFFARLLMVFSIKYNQREYFIALVLPMDKTTGTRNRDRDQDLRLTRVCARARSKAAFIQMDWVIRGALLAKDHGSKHTFEEFFVVKEVDDDLWMRIKFATLVTNVDL